MVSRYYAIYTMLVALSVALFPVHADNPPFGIVPKTQQFTIDSSVDLNTWHVQFKSLSEFVAALHQSEFKTLRSGETKLVYYVFFRTKPDLLIFAYCFKKEEKQNGSFRLIGHGENPALRDIQLTPVKLLDANAVAPPVNMGTIVRTDGRSTSLSGYAAKIDPDYTGPLTMHFQLWTQGIDQVRPEVSRTINWKSTF